MLCGCHYSDQLDNVCCSRVALIVSGCDLCLQRDSSMTPQSLELPPTSPLVTGSSGRSHGPAVTPQASLQAPGSGISLLHSTRGHIKQPSLAAALAGTAAGVGSSSAPTANPQSGLGAVQGFRSPGKIQAASGAVISVEHGLAVAKQAEAAVQADAQPQHSSLQPHQRQRAADAVVRGSQDDATSSASFDSWNSRRHNDTGATASTSQHTQADVVPASAAATAACFLNTQGETRQAAMLCGQAVSMAPRSSPIGESAYDQGKGQLVAACCKTHDLALCMDHI